MTITTNSNEITSGGFGNIFPKISEDFHFNKELAYFHVVFWGDIIYFGNSRNSQNSKMFSRWKLVKIAEKLVEIFIMKFLVNFFLLQIKFEKVFKIQKLDHTSWRDLMIFWRILWTIHRQIKIITLWEIPVKIFWGPKISKKCL